MQEKLEEEKTDGNTWLSWTEQSQRADKYKTENRKKCKKNQKKKKQLKIQDWPGQDNHREQIKSKICKKYQIRNKSSNDGTQIQDYLTHDWPG